MNCLLVLLPRLMYPNVDSHTVPERSSNTLIIVFSEKLQHLLHLPAAPSPLLK